MRIALTLGLIACVQVAQAGELAWPIDCTVGRDCSLGYPDTDRDGRGSCFWCFAGGNVVVIRHENIPGVFATRYDQHLHFEVWGRTYYDPVDPWAGKCGPNTGASLWRYPEQPWFRK